MPALEHNVDSVFHEVFLEPQQELLQARSSDLHNADCSCFGCIEVLVNQIHDDCHNSLEYWLGPQAWKLTSKLAKTCIEIFPDQGRLRLTGERLDKLVIPIGPAQGQDLTRAGDQKLLKSLIDKVKPAHILVSWPNTMLQLSRQNPEHHMCRIKFS